MYATLDRLERDKFVKAKRVNGEGQITYSITSAGMRDAQNWLTSPVVQSAQNKNELAIKLALAVTLPGVDTDIILQTQRISTLQSLQTLTTAKMSSSLEDSADLTWILILDSQIFNLEAELRWIDHVEGLLLSVAARGLAPQNELNNEPAKRGRPVRAEGQK